MESQVLEKEIFQLKEDVKKVKEALLGTEFNSGGIVQTLQAMKKDLERVEDCECEDYQERLSKLESKGITYELYIRFITFIFAIALTAYIGSTIKNILSIKHEKSTNSADYRTTHSLDYLNARVQISSGTVYRLAR